MDLKEEVIIAIMEHIEVFNEYYQQFLDCYDRFVELRNANPYCLDTETYFDMLVVQLRSLLLESNNAPVGLENYTFQSILKLVEDKKQGFMIINRLLKTPMYTSKDMKECTIEYALKSISNKSLCHYNNFHREDKYSYELIRMLRSDLINSEKEINIDYIVREIKSVFCNGIQVCIDNDLLLND